MRYFKITGGYIASPRVIPGAEEITEETYNNFLAAVSMRPEVPEGYGCRLTEDMEWETYPLPDMGEPDLVLSADEIVEILLGGAV